MSGRYLICFGPMVVELEIDSDVIFIEHQDQTEAYDGYAFANSVDIFNSPSVSRLRKYRHVLKTDTDVFLTPAFKDLMPERFTTGGGGYVNDQHTRDKLLKISRENGLRHRGVHNVDSTWYGSADQVINVGRLTARILGTLLDDHFPEGEGKWPGWYRGVASMYASEIAVNHLIDEIHRDGSKLDYPSCGDDPIADHPHIHCWHWEGIFNKFAYRDGVYKDVDTKGLDTTIVKNYCLSMALK